MKILYMGTPEFAVAPLRALLDAGHELVGVVTQPDKKQNRGMKVSFSPVKTFALSRGLEVFQPETLKEGALAPLLDEKKPDLIAVAAYGKFLPSYVLEAPPLGCINVHASLLPKYRGASPVQYALLEGEKETGVTIIHMEKTIDTGDMILRAPLAIAETDTSASLLEKLSPLGAALLVEAVGLLAEGKAPREKQDDASSSHAPMLTKELGKVDWSKPAFRVACLVRALDPWPAAYTEVDGNVVRLFDPQVEARAVEVEPGSVLAAGKDGFAVACGNGTVLRVGALQAGGGRRMAPADYFNGHPLKDGMLR